MFDYLPYSSFYIIYKSKIQKRNDRISAYQREQNDKVNAQIAESEKALVIQKNIYKENANKIFGEGAKLKKSAKAEIARLEALIEDLKSQLK